MALIKVTPDMTEQEQIATENSNNQYLNHLVNNIVSPKVFDTLVDLQTTYPGGSNRICVVAGSGKWYYWDYNPDLAQGQWKEGGVYQSYGIGSNSVTTSAIMDNAVTSAKIPNNAIITNKINNEAVTQDKIYKPYAAKLLCIYGTTSGTASALTLTVGMDTVNAFTTYAVTKFILHTDIAAGATLSINGYTPYPLYAYGEPVKAVYKAGDVLTTIYTSGKFNLVNERIAVDESLSAVSFNAISNNAVYNGLSVLESKLTEKTSYGVVSGLGVTAQSTPNMTVRVAAGTIYMPSGVRYTPAAKPSQAVNAAHPTYPRIDIVYVSDAGVISYLAGTAAASPAAPATPSGGMLLAEIYVDANATSIISANITDKRKRIYDVAGIVTQLLTGLSEATTIAQIRSLASDLLAVIRG